MPVNELSRSGASFLCSRARRLGALIGWKRNGRDALIGWRRRDAMLDWLLRGGRAQRSGVGKRSGVERRGEASVGAECSRAAERGEVERKEV